MARRRGGYQRPSQPAAVSGPGALSQRTDGKVPQMLPSGGDYGDRKALADQQSAAPISPQGGPQGATGGGPTPAASGPPGFGPAGAFSPTQRPGEPMTAGTDWGDGPGQPANPLPDEPYMVAKALYAISPTPELERLIARLARG